MLLNNTTYESPVVDCLIVPKVSADAHGLCLVEDIKYDRVLEDVPL